MPRKRKHEGSEQLAVKKARVDHDKPSGHRKESPLDNTAKVHNSSGALLKDSKVNGENEVAGRKVVEESKNAEQTDGANAETKSERRERRKKEKRAKKKAEKKLRDVDGQLIRRNQRWPVSSKAGGRLLSHDPIFVENENGHKFLISANDRELQLHSLQDSLLQRTHQAPKGRSITSFALDKVKGNLVYVAYDDHTVATWDWSAGSKAKHLRKFKANVLSMASYAPAEDNKLRLYYTAKLDGSHWGVFRGDSLLHTTDKALKSIQVLSDGLYVVCRAPKAILIGRSKGNSYVWIELPLNSTSWSSDVRLLGDNNRLLLAVGCIDGQIHLYSGLDSIFHRNSNLQKLPSPRILHWHREAVASVRFSADGNYIISGGRENVLVIWQLETGKKQFLPHLAARIDNIVVNPEGNQYAVQMGDNSTMVLSTTELKPVAYFGGLQTISRHAYRGAFSAIPRMSAALHPRYSDRLLVAVPSSHPISEQDDVARPFLQTFDVLNSRHMDRQALADNFVAQVGINPQGDQLIANDVKHLAVSHDGTFLATIDEWTPSRESLTNFAPDGSALDEEQNRRREVQLKIWAWDENQSCWALTMYWEKPHDRANGESWGHGTVVALVAHPTKNEFATVGEDNCVRVWKEIRSRPDSKKQGPLRWKCKFEVELPRPGSPLDDGQPTETDSGYLAYAEDGSLLAVAHPSGYNARGAAPVVRFVDPLDGKLHPYKRTMTDGPVRGLAFAGQRYFVAVSPRTVHVWDIVDDSPMYKAKLPGLQAEQTLDRKIDLAVHPDGTTVAVAVNKTVLVYNVKQSQHLHREELDTNVERVLTSKSGKGFTLVFDDATTRHLLPADSQALLERDGKDGDKALLFPPQTIDDDEEGDEEGTAFDLSTLTQRADSAALKREVEDGRPVVTAEQLAAAVGPREDGVLPSVREQFWAVMNLVARKP